MTAPGSFKGSSKAPFIQKPEGGYLSNMVPALVLLLSLNPQEAPRKVVLRRGGPPAIAEVPQYRNWNITDTVLDSSKPNLSLGGDGTLVVGPGKVMLIRFGDLDRVVKPTERIKSAKLVLVVTSPTSPTFEKASLLLRPWGEGVINTFGKMVKSTATEVADKGASTWTTPFAASGIYWERPGAQGGSDARLIPGTKFEGRSAILMTVKGLEAALQAQVDSPSQNFGLALQFSSPGSFGSSNGSNGEPWLELELEPVSTPAGPDLSVNWIEQKPEGVFIAHIENASKVDSPARMGVWSIRSVSQPPVSIPALAAGRSTEVTLTAPMRPEKNDPRFLTVGFHIQGDDANPRNNGQVIYPSGTPIVIQSPTSPGDWDRVDSQLRWLNDAFATQSRYAAATSGLKARFYVASLAASGVKLPTTTLQPDREFLQQVIRAAGVPDLRELAPSPGNLTWKGNKIARGFADRFPGVLGGDARGDGMLPLQISLNDDPLVTNQITNFGLIDELGLLSPTEVSWLNGMLEGQGQVPVPALAIVRILDRSGRAIDNADIEFYRVKDRVVDESPIFKSAIKGGAVTPALKGPKGLFGDLAKDWSNGLVMARIVRGGVEDWNAIKIWRVLDSASKGSKTVPIVELRFNLPSNPVDTTDLAIGKSVASGTASEVDQVAKLTTDGNLADVTIPSKSNITIDLTRDRALSLIQLQTTSSMLAKSFVISLYGTGQDFREATPWANEIDFPFSASQRGTRVDKSLSINYYSNTQRYRYVRIENTSDQPLNLCRVKVFGIKLEGE